jgi:hypothetical protein
MPEQEVIERAKRDKNEGKSPSTQAGEFVREEMHHIREGKHRAANTKQAIAIGLSKARRAGVGLPQRSGANTSARTRKQARRDSEKGHQGNRRVPSRTRSRAVSNTLQREGPSAASPANLSRQAKSAARKRGSAARRVAARRAVRTKGSSGLRSARKGAGSRKQSRTNS